MCCSGDVGWNGWGVTSSVLDSFIRDDVYVRSSHTHAHCCSKPAVAEIREATKYALKD